MKSRDLKWIALGALAYFFWKKQSLSSYYRLGANPAPRQVWPIYQFPQYYTQDGRYIGPR